jgi:hypothetical protein
VHPPLPPPPAEACYAESEAGDLVEDPGHVELLKLLADLNATDNTFFVVFPDDEDVDWAISVHTRPGALGDYEIERADPAAGDRDVTSHADHVTIATDVLTWVQQR